MLRQVLIFLFILIIPSSLYSQKVLAGIVKKTSTNTAIPLVQISIRGETDTLSTTADLNGKFIFRNLNEGEVILETAHYLHFKYDSIFTLGEDSTYITITLKEDSIDRSTTIYSEFNRNGALQDIKDMNVKLLLPGGFVSLSTNESDKRFELKYDLKYLSQGDFRLPGEDEIGYNLEVFKYLDEKYGKAWRMEVRKDVIGLKN